MFGLEIDWAIVGTEIFKGVIAVITGSIIAWVAYRFQVRLAKQKDVKDVDMDKVDELADILAKVYGEPVMDEGTMRIVLPLIPNIMTYEKEHRRFFGISTILGIVTTALILISLSLAF